MYKCVAAAGLPRGGGGGYYDDGDEIDSEDDESAIKKFVKKFV